MFQNEASGDQFKVILWRTKQKSKEKTKITTKSDPISNPISKEKTEAPMGSDLKILQLMADNSYVSISELMTASGLSRSGIKKIIRNLKESGKVRRIGSNKGGHWEVIG